jgi:hypothetical protein
MKRGEIRLLGYCRMSKDRHGYLSTRGDCFIAACTKVPKVTIVIFYTHAHTHTHTHTHTKSTKGDYLITACHAVKEKRAPDVTQTLSSGIRKNRHSRLASQ